MVFCRSVVGIVLPGQQKIIVLVLPGAVVGIVLPGKKKIDRSDIIVLVLRRNPITWFDWTRTPSPTRSNLVYRLTQLKTLPSRNNNDKQISLMNRHDDDVFIIAENIPQVVRDMGEVGTNQSAFCRAQTIASNTALTMLTYLSC